MRSATVLFYRSANHRFSTALQTWLILALPLHYFIAKQTFPFFAFALPIHTLPLQGSSSIALPLHLRCSYLLPAPPSPYFPNPYRALAIRSSLSHAIASQS
jgi:hypothetical protein